MVRLALAVAVEVAVSLQSMLLMRPPELVAKVSANRKIPVVVLEATLAAAAVPEELPGAMARMVPDLVMAVAQEPRAAQQTLELAAMARSLAAEEAVAAPA